MLVLGKKAWLCLVLCLFSLQMGLAIMKEKEVNELADKKAKVKVRQLVRGPRQNLP